MFPKSVLKDITQRAMNKHEESRLKLKVLGAAEEQVIQKNMDMLQLYEKMKYMAAIANKNLRKDKHYGFNLWR